MTEPWTTPWTPEVVYVDQGVARAPLTERVLSRLPGLSPTLLEPGQGPDPAHEGRALWLRHFQGRFLRHCPGTKIYHCCGYRILHLAENCPLDCAYCILQSYFQDRALRVFANMDDAWEQLERAFTAEPLRRFRVGTGEFADSLALEHLTGQSADLVRFLARFDNVRLELKTKTTDLSWMEAVSDPRLVLPAWSVNAPEVACPAARGGEEGVSAPLEERLRAASRCIEAGMRVCLHFDPILRYPGWEQGYDQAVEMILDHVRPESVAYLSLGSFRFMPGLNRTIARRHAGMRGLHEEYVPGLDNKMRLLRPLRTAQFLRVAGALRRGGFRDEQLYFCMESDAVWRAVFGCTPRDFGGLAGRLMDRAFGTGSRE